MVVGVQAQVAHAEVVDADLQVALPTGKAGVDGVGGNEAVGIPLHDGVQFLIADQQILVEDVLQARDHRFFNTERVHLAQAVFRLGIRQAAKRPLAEKGIYVNHPATILFVVLIRNTAQLGNVTSFRRKPESRSLAERRTATIILFIKYRARLLPFSSFNAMSLFLNETASCLNCQHCLGEWNVDERRCSLRRSPSPPCQARGRL